ncbi:phosphoserine aminotransferase [Billgrantia sulfidoxydans]|uniref:Phosphoserine aminotransferase n=1 Tax=Billgrantia sulfidoxydans TaxID=2733484 RepID=A0ABX7W782_9GAMM|nr:hypothetical protein [Halomonas sulfidoxydans]QTP56050.1 phosphoserine aminotransferase [Halomonas sulfidoxydans]
MTALMRQAPRLGRGVAYARAQLAAHWLASPARSDGRRAPATVHAMGLGFANPLGIAAGFDRWGRLGWRAQALGFGCLELGSLTPRQASALSLGPRPPQASRLVIGFNLGLPPRCDLAQAAPAYLAGLAAAWHAADYAVINLGSPQAHALTQPPRLGELESLLAALVERRDRLAAQAGRCLPLAVKLRLTLDSPLPAIVAHLAVLGIDGLILASDAGPPATPQRYAAWHDPLRQRLACRQVAQAHACLAGRVSLVSVGGIATAAHAEARLQAGAALVQVHDALVYEGPRVALGMLRELC